MAEAIAEAMVGIQADVSLFVRLSIHHLGLVLDLPVRRRH
jgi:hypothetical protein